MAALVRCYAGVYPWGVPTGSLDKTLLDRHKTMLQDSIEAETGIQWDKPDPTGKGGTTTTTGNTGRSLLHLHRIVSLLPNQHKPLFEKWGRLLSILIRVLSSKEKVNIQRYKTVCTELYVLMLEEVCVH